MLWVRNIFAAACLAALPAALAAQPAPPFSYRQVEGQPVDTRPLEKADSIPAFSGQTRAPYHKSVDVKVAVLTAKLASPWAVAFLPGGNFLVTQRLGSMVVVSGQGEISAPLAGVPAVASDGGQGGLLDVALDPDFSSSHRIFFTYDEPLGTQSRIVVGRAVLDMAAGALRDVAVIFRSRPAVSIALYPTKQGSRIAIGKDGFLYVSIGDRDSVKLQPPPWPVAQNLDTHLGKIIRIAKDGAPAPGNPFAGTADALPEIWATGVRSQEGLAFDPKGRLWETEHGPRGGDELNLIARGRNYGWPVISYGVDYPGWVIGDGITAKTGMEQPRYYWDPVIGPSGLVWYDADLFPQWKGSLLVGGLRGMLLDRLTIANDKVVAEEPLLTDLHSRIRDVRVGPDGAVYVLTDTGSLLKLTPG